MPQTSLFQILRSRWRTALLSFVVLMLIGIALLALVPRKYSSTSSVLLRSPVDPMQTERVPMNQTPSAVQIQTQVDLLKSQRIAEETAEHLPATLRTPLESRWQDAGAKGSFRDYVVGVIRQAIRVESTRESNVLTVSMTTREPELSAALCNAYVEQFLRISLKVQTETSEHFNGIYEQELDAAQKRLIDAQTALASFQTRNDVLLQGSRFDAEMDRLNELSNRVVALQDSLAQASSRSAAASGQDARPANAAEDEVTARLYTRLEEANAELSEAQVSLGRAHPRLIELNKRVQSIERQIGAQTARLKGDLNSSRNALGQQLTAVRDLEEKQRRQVLRLNEVRASSAALQRRAEAAQTAYDQILAAAQTTALQAKSKAADATTVQRASASPEPSSPNVKMSLAGLSFVSMLLALLMAMLREAMDKRVRSLDQLPPALGQPLPFQIPDFSSSAPSLPGAMRRPRLIGHSAE